MSVRTTPRSTIIVRIATVIVALFGVVTIGTPLAQADLVNGVCKLDLTFIFGGGVTLLGLPPPYTITGDSTNSHCVNDEFVSTTTSLSGGANAANSHVRCGVLVGTGGWEQSWSGFEISLLNGSHTVVGTWLGAVMFLSGLPGNPPERFNSVVVLTPHPDEPFANAKKTAKCAKGEAISSIRMLGVQVFVDPPDEDDFQL